MQSDSEQLINYQNSGRLISCHSTNHRSYRLIRTNVIVIADSDWDI